MTEREKHINNLTYLKITLTEEQRFANLDKSLEYAISSLNTDEAYQLEYEHIPYITLDELKEIREEINHLQTYKMFNGALTLYISKDDVIGILDKKISERCKEGKEDG